MQHIANGIQRMVGTTLSHYKIESELGRGGMGVVYRAFDTKLDRAVALKFLAAHLLNDPIARERFVREAKSAAMLRHDNICAIYEVQDAPDGGIFIVMPLYEGRSLKDILEDGPVEPERALSYVRQIAAGLHAASAKQLVHRDIKPGNILLTPEDGIKILDFGLAKSAGHADLTASRATVGTMAYMSPEQVQNQAIDARSDLWSMGIVLYELLTGEKPFDGAYEAAIVYSIVNQDIDLSHPLIPETVRPLLRDLLQRDPADRIASAQDVIERLRLGSAGEKASTVAHDSDAHSKSQTPVAASPRRWVISAGFLAFLVIAFSVWNWSSSRARTGTASDEMTPLRTIAVMPFENAGNDTAVQFLCDGIAESLINWLASVPDVKVISKSAAFRERDHVDDTKRLAASLGVNRVIRGRLEQVGDQVVVSVSLIDTQDDSQLWGDRLVRSESEILFLERSIVSAIKDGLQLKVSNDISSSASGGTTSSAAYNHYLRGHYLIQSTDVAGIEEGIEELREAIKIDARYAQPYADMADALSQMLSYGIGSFDEVKEEARSAAYTAVALAPDLAEAQTALATILQYFVFDWEAVEKAYEAAIALAPLSPVPYHRYTDFLVLTLRFQRAQEMANRAIEIDPLDGSSMHAAGLVPLIAGDFSRAARAFGEWNQFHPESRWSYVKHALALALDGQCNESLAQATSAEELFDGQPNSLMESWIAWGYKVCGNTELYARSKSRIQAEMKIAPEALEPGYAYLYAIEGDTDSLISMLETIVATKNPLTAFAQIFVLDYLGWGISDTMPKDKRYLEILRELNFPPPDLVD